MNFTTHNLPLSFDSAITLEGVVHLLKSTCEDLQKQINSYNKDYENYTNEEVKKLKEDLINCDEILENKLRELNEITKNNLINKISENEEINNNYTDEQIEIVKNYFTNFKNDINKIVKSIDLSTTNNIAIIKEDFNNFKNEINSIVNDLSLIKLVNVTNGMYINLTECLQNMYTNFLKTTTFTYNALDKYVRKGSLQLINKITRPIVNPSNITQAFVVNDESKYNLIEMNATNIYFNLTNNYEVIKTIKLRKYTKKQITVTNITEKCTKVSENAWSIPSTYYLYGASTIDLDRDNVREFLIYNNINKLVCTITVFEYANILNSNYDVIFSNIKNDKITYEQLELFGIEYFTEYIKTPTPYDIHIVNDELLNNKKVNVNLY